MIKMLSRKQRWGAASERFLFHHPFFGFLTVMLAMPVCILVALFAATVLGLLPLALLFGWL